MRPTILVLGCGDIGSAVACELFLAGARVLVCDLERPAHARRGMSFIDALFDGEAMLEGVLASRARDLDQVRLLLDVGNVIPVASLPEQQLLAQLRPEVLVDATMRRQATPPDLRALAPTAIGLGPGFTPGVNCNVAIETLWGDALGMVLRDRSTAAPAGGPPALGGAGRERFVAAQRAGLWRTGAAIGKRVHAGEVVGTIDDEPLHAPIDGRLRGLTHDGVTVIAGESVIEVDPRQPPEVFGVGMRARAVAHGVCRALGLEQGTHE